MSVMAPTWVFSFPWELWNSLHTHGLLQSLSLLSQAFTGAAKMCGTLNTCGLNQTLSLLLTLALQFLLSL